ncbi:MAG: hypothetical protein WC718_00275 [Phycisphaerales bacterium]|jgi:hypothetical protein
MSLETVIQELADAIRENTKALNSVSELTLVPDTKPQGTPTPAVKPAPEKPKKVNPVVVEPEPEATPVTAEGEVIEPTPEPAAEPEPAPADPAPAEDAEAQRAELLNFVRSKVAAAKDSNTALAELGKITEELKTSRNIKDMDPAMFAEFRAAVDARL